MTPGSMDCPDDGWVARRGPLRLNMDGNSDLCHGGRWRTTNTDAAKSAGSWATSSWRASTPPAEAPMTIYIPKNDSICQVAATMVCFYAPRTFFGSLGLACVLLATI